jgi:hypothetical protein
LNVRDRNEVKNRDGQEQGGKDEKVKKKDRKGKEVKVQYFRKHNRVIFVANRPRPQNGPTDSYVASYAIIKQIVSKLYEEFLLAI